VYSHKELKNKIRKEYLKNRLKISDDKQKELSANAFEMFFKNVTITEKSIIAGYWSIKAELDVIPILKELGKRGHISALPHVENIKKPLVFRKWHEDMIMSEGMFNIKEPSLDNILDPDIILVPLLAFDDRGYRVGYGAGLYDRTIVSIKENKPVFTIGMAYESQLCDYVPVEETDVSIDMIVTDKNLYI